MSGLINSFVIGFNTANHKKTYDIAAGWEGGFKLNNNQLVELSLFGLLAEERVFL